MVVVVREAVGLLAVGVLVVVVVLSMRGAVRASMRKYMQGCAGVRESEHVCVGGGHEANNIPRPSASTSTSTSTSTSIRTTIHHIYVRVY